MGVAREHQCMMSFRRPQPGTEYSLAGYLIDQMSALKNLNKILFLDGDLIIVSFHQRNRS
jgi:hypothetical protein